MSRRIKDYTTVAQLLLLFLSFMSSTPAFQDKQKKNKTVPVGRPILWKAPDDLPARNLFLGAGGDEMRLDTSSLTFLKAEQGGYSPKFRVRDGAGRVWVAKLGKEAQPETAAVRLLWAIGYQTEINYLVPCVHIPGAPKPIKKVERCEGDGFANFARPIIIRVRSGC
jgi:hypothetical protein